MLIFTPNYAEVKLGGFNVKTSAFAWFGFGGEQPELRWQTKTNLPEINLINLTMHRERRTAKEP